MSVSRPLDSLGQRRSPAAATGYLAGRPSRNKGRRYPADPPRTEEIIALMRCAGDGLHGDRTRGLIAVPWRAGPRIQDALDLTELDLDPRRGSLLVRSGKGGRRREVGIDDWAFDQLQPRLTARQDEARRTLFCVINGRTRVRQAGIDGHLEARISSWREKRCLPYGCPKEVQRRVARARDASGA
jgi:integrase